MSDEKKPPRPPRNLREKDTFCYTVNVRRGAELVRGARFIGVHTDSTGKQWIAYKAGPFRIP